MQKWYQSLSAMVMIVANATIFPSVAAQPDVHSQIVGSELQYIQDKANEFLNHYNQEHYTNWQALALNPKMMVPQCVSSMSATWGSKFMNGSKTTIDVERYVVIVTCKKDNSGLSWSVDVPTTRPDHVTVHH